MKFDSLVGFLSSKNKIHSPLYVVYYLDKIVVHFHFHLYFTAGSKFHPLLNPRYFLSNIMKEPHYLHTFPTINLI